MSVDRSKEPIVNVGMKSVNSEGMFFVINGVAYTFEVLRFSSAGHHMVDGLLDLSLQAFVL